jgi:hypothetical protein
MKCTVIYVSICTIQHEKRKSEINILRSSSHVGIMEKKITKEDIMWSIDALCLERKNTEFPSGNM